MENRTFDDIARWLGAGATRRAALGLAAALGVGSAAVHDVLAGKKKKKKKFCLNGENVKAKNKKKKKRLRKQGATRGKCPNTCTPTCPTNDACGMDDGCGNLCGCPGGEMCLEGACTPCTVLCGGDAESCGAGLQTALTAGGTVYLCPGQYATPTGFIAAANTSIYGAGSGDDQANSTILTLSGMGGTVLTLTPGSPSTIFGLRITGGDAPAGAGGIVSAGGGVLTIDSCAIVDNTGATGGLQIIGILQMVDSLVSGNTGTAGPGGLYLNPLLIGGTSEITNSIFDRNEGPNFGGIEVDSSAIADVNIDSASQIINNTMTPVSGDQAGGIGAPAGNLATVTVSGTTISGNTEPQCHNVTGCPS